MRVAYACRKTKTQKEQRQCRRVFLCLEQGRKERHAGLKPWKEEMERRVEGRGGEGRDRKKRGGEETRGGEEKRGNA